MKMARENTESDKAKFVIAGANHLTDPEADEEDGAKDEDAGLDMLYRSQDVAMENVQNALSHENKEAQSVNEAEHSSETGSKDDEIINENMSLAETKHLELEKKCPTVGEKTPVPEELRHERDLSDIIDEGQYVAIANL
ncbi:hypothetical protein Tco_0947155 [Tanacetum coccineum]